MEDYDPKVGKALCTICKQILKGQNFYMNTVNAKKKVKHC